MTEYIQRFCKLRQIQLKPVAEEIGQDARNTKRSIRIV